jgi:hypothetical protein
MWFFLNNAMLSIVAHRDKPDTLLVRARVKGDIEAVFPEARILVLDSADYRYRSALPRDIVAAALQQQVQAVAYPNFKASVSQPARKQWYHRVWELGNAVQK